MAFKDEVATSLATVTPAGAPSVDIGETSTTASAGRPVTLPASVTLWASIARWGMLAITTDGTLGLGVGTDATWAPSLRIGPDGKVTVNKGFTDEFGPVRFNSGDTTITPAGDASPLLGNGWSNYGGTLQPATIHTEPAGFVTLSGTIKNGALTIGTIFTLPAGSIPARDHMFYQPGAGGSVVRVDVCGTTSATPGAVTVVTFNGATSAAYLSLAGIRFPTYV